MCEGGGTGDPWASSAPHRVGGVVSADREAALWEMEEHQLQERHQLVKQQLKDQYFLQRHDLLRKHEKVRRPGRDAGQLDASPQEGLLWPGPRWRDKLQGNCVRDAPPDTSVLGSLSSKPVLGYLKLLHPPLIKKQIEDGARCLLPFCPKLKNNILQNALEPHALAR